MGIVTGHGADETQQQSLVASAAVAVIAALATASGQQAQQHGQRQYHTYKFHSLFHVSFLDSCRFYFQPVGLKIQKKNGLALAAKPSAKFLSRTILPETTRRCALLRDAE